MAKKLSVSIVIPSYNSEKWIARCLSSLVQQETTIPYEIIVVDSSKDSTPEIVTKQFPSVRLVKLDKQTYPGAGRNIGVEKAKGNILAFIDSDCVAHPGWLEAALKGIKKGYNIVGGSVKNANPQTLISIADHILTFNEFLPGMPQREVCFMPTCNFICKKEVFKEIGGFPPDLLAGEDTIFNYKAAKHYKLFFDPEIQIAHHNRERFKKFFGHHYTFGKHSALLRKKVKLPGSIFAKYPFLSLLVPLVRLTRISLRMMRWNRKELFRFIITFPLIVAGVSVWSFGFIKSSYCSS